MNPSYSLDPSYGIAKVFVTLAMVFCAVLVAVLGYMVYLAYLGVMIDWNLSVRTPFYDFYPEQNSSVWHMIFFSVPAVGFGIAFFVLGWLKKKLQQESQQL
jgi:hypothetical protein